MEGHGHSPRKSSPDAPGSPAHVVTSSELNNISHELKTNCTIDPERSKYIQYWDVLIVIALVYTATITPYEIGFIHTDTEIDSMFVCNQIINGIFLIDVVLQFFLHYQQPKEQGGDWVRNQRKIVRHYLHGSFAIDFISTLPFGAFSVEGFPGSSTFKKLKIIRLMRLLRLTKLSRIARSSRLVSRYRAQISVSFGFLNLTGNIVLILVASHWIACIWGFVGHSSNPSGRLENSWMGKYLDDADDPPKWNVNLPRHQYIISLYFSIMTLTTVGYGDVGAQNIAEYAVLAVVMLLGGFMWAFIIGAVCGTVSTMDIKRIEFQQKFDQVNFMLSDLAIDHPLAIRVRAFLLQCEERERRSNYSTLFEDLSEQLQADLVEEIFASSLDKIAYFKSRSPEFRLAVFKAMRIAVFAPGERLCQPATLYLIINHGGLVGQDGRIHIRGSSMNKDFMLESWSQELFKPGVALTYVQVHCLTRDQMREICERFPADRKEITRARMRVRARRAAGRTRAPQISSSDDARVLADGIDSALQDAEGPRVPKEAARERGQLRQLEETDGLARRRGRATQPKPRDLQFVEPSRSRSRRPPPQQGREHLAPRRHARSAHAAVGGRARAGGDRQRAERRRARSVGPAAHDCRPGLDRRSLGREVHQRVRLRAWHRRGHVASLSLRPETERRDTGGRCPCAHA